MWSYPFSYGFLNYMLGVALSFLGLALWLRLEARPWLREGLTWLGVPLVFLCHAVGGSMLMTACQVSDYTGAAALLDDLPKAQWLLGDRGYDADWYRGALQENGIKPCIPGRKSLLKPIKYNKRRYRSRNFIEIMFGPLRDWRSVATPYDRCPTVYFSAFALAATLIFSL